MVFTVVAGRSVWRRSAGCDNRRVPAAPSAARAGGREAGLARGGPRGPPAGLASSASITGLTIVLIFALVVHVGRQGRVLAGLASGLLPIVVLLLLAHVFKADVPATAAIARDGFLKFLGYYVVAGDPVVRSRQERGADGSAVGSCLVDWRRWHCVRSARGGWSFRSGSTCSLNTILGDRAPIGLRLPLGDGVRRQLCLGALGCGWLGRAESFDG